MTKLPGAQTSTHITCSKWKCHFETREIVATTVKELLHESQNDKTPRSSDKYFLTWSKWKCHFETREIAATTVKELLRELQNDKTPRSSDKYSYNFIEVKVSFWDSRNSRYDCEGVTSRASKWQKLPGAQTNTHITWSKWKCHCGTHEIGATTVKELLRELQNDKTPRSSDKYTYNLI